MYNIGSNVWSLGITLIEIISGELPYKDSKGRITGNIILLQKQIGEFGTKNLEDLLRQMSISDSIKVFIWNCLVTPIKERTYEMIAETELYTSVKEPYNEVVKKYAKQYKSEKEALEKHLEQDLLKSKVEPKAPDTDPKRVLEQETFSFNIAKAKEVSKISIRNTTEILEGIHELDDRPIAIKKRFFKSRENPQKKKDRFIYEIQVIKKLKNESPFITYLYKYDIKDTKGSLYMELMDMNLKELYLVMHEKEKKFSKQLLGKEIQSYKFTSLLECITVSVVNALSYCHEKNIVHCDVKPTNVLINQHGKIKLTDFDSAIDRDNLDNYDRIGGTMAYWAPDLFVMDKERSQGTPESQPQFNPKRDIWSLGITLAEALLGRLPYLEKDDKAPKGYEVLKYLNKINYAKEFENCGFRFEKFLEYSHFYKKFVLLNYDISILRFLSTCLQFMKHIPSVIELQQEEFYQDCLKISNEIYTITKERLKSLQEIPCSSQPALSFKNVDVPGSSSIGQIETSIILEEGPKYTLDEEYQRLKLSIHELLFEIKDFRHLNRNQEIFKEYTKLAHKLYETGKYANIPIYPHLSKTKGLAIIINEDPIGSDKDAKNLEDLFKAMAFEIYEGRIIPDLEKDEILKKLKAFVNDERQKKYDSCIVVIIGHGNYGIICDKYSKAIDIEHEILNLFNGQNAPNLVGKPKFFIFQACRGGNSEDGVVVPNYQQEVSRQELSSFVNYQSEIVPKKSSNSLLKQSPTHNSQRVSINSDFFILYSTVPTMVSYRNEQGSVFINAISEVFYQFAHKIDLEDMVTIIKGKVGSQPITVINEHTKQEEIKFQQPQFVTTNSKKYFMFPGVHIE
uniref:mitogen-activated protein kinase kinase n=1 Tax=Acrobeloides nanus TaxID=290746 RepID=A0A914DHS5_9BILA